MNPEDIHQTWNLLDRQALESIVRSGPEPVFATISGAHLYGFASPDSDVDLRGAFLLPAGDLLGLRLARETVSVSDERGGVELDWVAHDLRKFAWMMVRHNGYVLEQLFSPLVVLTTPAHDELIELGRGCVTRPIVRHYLGFAHGRRKRLREPESTVKHLLYAYRVYLTGIHALRTGEIEANLAALNEIFGLGQIGELIARKQEGHETMGLDPGELERHETLLDELERRLHEAHEESRIPQEATTRDALHELVVRVRMEGVGR